MNWTLARAKDHLSELVRRAALDGPQTISVRGQDAVVVISKADYEQMCDPGAPKTLKELLMGLDLEDMDLARDQTPARDLEL